MAAHQKEMELFLHPRSGYDTRRRPGQVDGVVQDASGEAKAGVMVRLTKLSNGVSRLTYTGSNGAFSFDLERIDSYRLDVTDPATGRVVTQNIDLGDGERKQLTIKLS